MHPLRYLIAATLALAILSLTGDAPAAAKAPAKPPKKAPKANPARANAARARAQVARVQGQIRKRTKGQRVFIVQARRAGWAKTALMPQAAAVVTRARLRNQGFSAHIHNHGIKGALVHYSMGHWRAQAVFGNGPAAQQAAALLRANGMKARVVVR